MDVLFLLLFLSIVLVMIVITMEILKFLWRAMLGFLPGVPYILVDGKPVEQPNDLLKEAC